MRRLPRTGAGGRNGAIRRGINPAYGLKSVALKVVNERNICPGAIGVIHHPDDKITHHRLAGNASNRDCEGDACISDDD